MKSHLKTVSKTNSIENLTTPLHAQSIRGPVQLPPILAWLQPLIDHLYYKDPDMRY